MDAKEAQIREKLESCLKQATELTAQLQAIEQGDRIPHYDEIELPAHAMGQRFSRAIQEERARELALKEFKGTRGPDCNQLCRVERCRRGRPTRTTACGDSVLAEQP